MNLRLAAHSVYLPQTIAADYPQKRNNYYCPNSDKQRFVNIQKMLSDGGNGLTAGRLVTNLHVIDTRVVKSLL
jgi:hypothetical protein